MSALVPYKRIDTAIRAAALLGAPLKIIGTGPDAERLHALAGPDVEFLGHVDDLTLRTLYRGARAVLLPGEEDFGISPVEAQACGRPVVALARGGALETVTDGVSGLLVDDESPAAFADAMGRVDTLPLTPAEWQARAAAFGIAQFEQAFTARVAETMAGGGQW